MICIESQNVNLKAGPMLGKRLDTPKVVVQRRTWSKIMAQTIMDNASHPLHHTLEEQRSSRSRRPISLRCRAERCRTSFVPTAIRLYNTSGEGGGLSSISLPPIPPPHTLDNGQLQYIYLFVYLPLALFHMELLCAILLAFY